MIEALVEHVAGLATSFVTVALAHTAEPVDVLAEETPAAWMWLDAEAAASSQLLGNVSQDVTRAVHVFVVGRHAEMDALRTEIRTAAIGFAADQYHTPLEFVEGRLAAIKGEWLWWLDVYTTRTEIRQF